MTWGVHFNS